MRFFGYDLELTVETVLAAGDGPSLFTASDSEGTSWLVAQVDYRGSDLAWLCAPMSARAVQAVVDGRADPRDALRHSLTGTIELVTAGEGSAIEDQCFLCGDLPAELLRTIPEYFPVPAAT